MSDTEQYGNEVFEEEEVPTTNNNDNNKNTTENDNVNTSHGYDDDFAADNDANNNNAGAATESPAAAAAAAENAYADESFDEGEGKEKVEEKARSNSKASSSRARSPSHSNGGYSDEYGSDDNKEEEGSGQAKAPAAAEPLTHSPQPPAKERRASQNAPARSPAPSSSQHTAASSSVATGGDGKRRQPSYSVASTTAKAGGGKPSISNNKTGGGKSGGGGIRLKAGAFVAKGIPSQTTKGTPFPRNVIAVARIRPFSDAELRQHSQQKDSEAAAATSTPRTSASTTPTKKDAAAKKKKAAPVTPAAEKDTTAAADAAVPFRVRNGYAAAADQPLQSLVRIGLPEQGVFNTFALDGAVWGLDTSAIAGHREEGANVSASNGSSDEQSATWAAVGAPLVQSVVMPFGHEEGNNADDAKEKATSTVTYGNACLISYGASNSGKSFALFGAIHPPCPPPAAPKSANNAAAATLANKEADAKAQDEAFFYANKNRAKRQAITKTPPKKRGTSPAAAAGGSNNNHQLLTAKQCLPEADVAAVTPADGLIVRAAASLLNQLSGASSNSSNQSKASSSSSSPPAPAPADVYVACLRLHNERLTDLCDLSDPHEDRQITAQLYYLETSDAAANNKSADPQQEGGGEEGAGAPLHYYGLKGVRPTKVTSVAEVKELLVRARQQVQRAPAGYLATDVVPSLKGQPDQKDVAVKAKAAKELARETKDPSVAAERRKKEAEAEAAKPSNSSASAIHGSTVVVILYLVPTPKANDGDEKKKEGATLPPRTAMQKIIFVDLPDSNAVSKGVSSTSVNAGMEIAFTDGEAAETPLQISNDKAINTMLLALGSSLSDSVRYGRGRFVQHQHLLRSPAGARALQQLLGSNSGTNAVTPAAEGSNNNATTTTTVATTTSATTGPTHYRNSLLTRVLKEACYGPNTFTAVLGCLSPLATEVAASHKTLRFLHDVKRQPVTAVGWEELEALRLRNEEEEGSGNASSSPLPFEKTAILGSLEGSAECVAFDASVVRRAAEKAKVNPYTMLQLGATLAAGAASALAPTNTRKVENDFFKAEATARNDLAILFQTELTAFQKQGYAERLAIARRANQSDKLREAIAKGNANIAPDGSATPASAALLDADDFEAQFRAPYKVTTSKAAAPRAHIANDTSSFIRDHHRRYNFRGEPKGTAHVSTNTRDLSNQTFSNNKQLEEDKKKIAAGEMEAKAKKVGPPRIPNKKKPEPEPEPEPPAPLPKKPTVAEVRSGVPVPTRNPPIVRAPKKPATEKAAAAEGGASPNKPRGGGAVAADGSAVKGPAKKKAAADEAAAVSPARKPEAPKARQDSASPRNARHASSPPTPPNDGAVEEEEKASAASSRASSPDAAAAESESPQREDVDEEEGDAGREDSHGGESFENENAPTAGEIEEEA